MEDGSDRFSVLVGPGLRQARSNILDFSCILLPRHQEFVQTRNRALDFGFQIRNFVHRLGVCNVLKSVVELGLYIFQLGFDKHPCCTGIRSSLVLRLLNHHLNQRVGEQLEFERVISPRLKGQNIRTLLLRNTDIGPRLQV